MSETMWLLSAGFGLLLIVGIPFGIALGLITIAVLFRADIPSELLPQTLIGGTQSFSLLAIPFFMLAGELMTAGGLSQRMITLANVFVRHLRGGLGHVAILAACIFSAISGSAPATTAAIGAIIIPAMVAKGYDKPFATALAVSAGVLGPLIPPSIAAVIWGVIAEQSIAKLFIASILPGILLAIGLMILCYIYAWRNDVPLEPRASVAEIKTATKDGIWAIGAPVLVLGGIYSGAFTPTEAAVVSCVYSLLVGMFVEKRLKLSMMPDIVLSATRITAIVMFIIAASSGFGLLVAQEQIATHLANWLSASIETKWVMLLMVNVFLILICSVMDEIAIMVILGPLLIALAHKFNVDPIHFGTIIVTNSSIGMAAPPIGYCLFVGMAITGLKLGQIARAIWPMIGVMFIVLMLVTYVPGFSTWLPNLLN